jgi:hypothetical protein
VYIAEQLGHEDPNFSVRVYAKAVKRRDRLEGEYLEAFDRALEWATNGPQAPYSPTEPARADQVESQKSHQEAIIRNQGR